MPQYSKHKQTSGIFIETLEKPEKGRKFRLYSGRRAERWIMTKYTTYFSTDESIKRLAREPNYELRLLLYDSAYEVDAAIANDIIYSIVHGISYDDIRKIRYIPVGKSAFYDKRKMTLAQFWDRMRIYGAL